MSSSAKTLARLEDLTIGSFALVPSSETVDHLVRYLSTWSGNDKLFMIIQYSIKLIVPFLRLRARLQHRAGLRTEPLSTAADGLAKFGGLLGDARMLCNIWGLLPIIKWLTSLERNPPPTRKLLTIERLQGWSMLAYYPLEHLYYLLAHSIIPPQIPLPSVSRLWPSSTGEAKQESIHLNAGIISRVSTRLWAVYVFLQLLHLQEDRRLLKAKERALSRSKTVAAQVEKEELRKRWDALWSEVVVNLSYAPLTIHWSLEKGLFQNDVWVGVFGLVAALASWRSGWKATALPPAPSSESVQSEKDHSSDIVTDEDILSPMDLTNSTVVAA